MHFNPKVREPVEKLLAMVKNFSYQAVAICRLVWLIEHCKLVLTDSGGVQEEAPSLGKSVLVIMNANEKPKSIVANISGFADTRVGMIVREVTCLLADPWECWRRSTLSLLYGDGGVAGRIVEILEADFGKSYAV